jgi:LPS export ABC transporter protein LptC
MIKKYRYNLNYIAMVFSMAMFFLSCKDNYERVGQEAKKKIFPQGVARDFVFTYTETKEPMNSEQIDTSQVVAVLRSPISEDFDNLAFPYRTFPKGLHLDFFDSDKNKSIVMADYGIVYNMTNLIDLRGNVVLESYDGKKLETPQLYWDRTNDWIFSQGKFKFTNPEDGTVMYGEGMDFNKDLSFFNAHKTSGLYTIKDE